MTRVIMFLLVLNLVSTQGISNDKSILIYSSKEDFLISRIEKTIAELRIAEDNTLLFDDVTNLNQITSSIASEQTLRETIVNYSNQDFFEPLNTDEDNRDSISKILLQHDYFLIISSNLVFDAIEYQFYLYEVNVNKHRFPTISPSPIKTENIIINLNDEQKYLLLANAIKRLFPEVNIEPQAKISTESSLVFDNTFYYSSLYDTLKLYSGQSIDLDTDRKKWTYTWRQVDNLNKSQMRQANFIQRGEVAKIIFSSTGEYQFGLTISDGVESSKEHIINVMVLQPPKIELIPHQIVNYAQKSLFKSKGKIENNECIILGNHLEGWDIHFQEIDLNKKDTLELLRYYYEMRKQYQQAKNEQSNIIKNDTTSSRNPKDKSIPTLEAFLNNPIKYTFDFDTTYIEEGIKLKFPYNGEIFNHSNLELYLQQNGVTSNRTNLNLTNKIFAPIYFSFNYHPNYFQFKNLSKSNQFTLVNFMELNSKANLVLLSGDENNTLENNYVDYFIDLGIGVSLIPRTRFPLDTTRFINLGFDISASATYYFLNFLNLNIGLQIGANVKLYPLKENIEIPPKLITGRNGSYLKTSELDINWVASSNTIFGVPFRHLHLPQVEFMPYGGFHLAHLRNETNEFEFSQNDNIYYGVELRYRFFVKNEGSLTTPLTRLVRVIIRKLMRVVYAKMNKIMLKYFHIRNC